MAEEMEDSFLIFAICRTDALARNKEDKTSSIDLSLSNIVGQEEIKCWIKNRLGLDCFQSSDLKSYFVIFL